MPQPPLDPPCADAAPTAAELTAYDEQHLVTYLRLLDAAADGADWEEVARVVLHKDSACDPIAAKTAWNTHLARAKWMSECGYLHLLKGRLGH